MALCESDNGGIPQRDVMHQRSFYPLSSSSDIDHVLIPGLSLLDFV